MNNPNLRRAIRGPLLALALVGALAGTALATSAVDFSSTPLAKGTTAGSVQFNTGAIKFQTKGAAVFNTVMITVKPGGTSGWHTHPGVVLVTVKEGEITFYDQTCVFIRHPAGSSFVEADGDGPGLAHNEGSIDAIVYATFVAEAGTSAFRLDAANPGCSQN